MRRSALASLATWLLAGALCVRAVGLTDGLLGPGQSSVTPMPRAPEPTPEWSVDSLYAWGGTIVDSNPFRADRTGPGAAAVLQDVSLLPETAAPPVPVPPRLPSLHGLIGSGERWEAVLANVRGRDAALLVRPGDTVGGFHVREVGASWVVLVDADTTLRLTLRRGHP